MKYELTGKDLAKKYENRQDPLFHIGESFELAKGEDFVVRLYTCGEVSITENGEWADEKDVIAKYDTDEKLNEAFDKGILEYRLNNWYEPQIFVNGEYMETPDWVVFSFDEALEAVKSYLDSPEAEKDITEFKEENQLTFDVEKEYLKGETFRYAVASDGTKDGDWYDVSGDEEMGNKIVIGFTVNLYRGTEHINTEFYPVQSDMSKPPVADDTGEYVYQNNEQEVLAKIKADYPAGKYQNNAW